LPENRMVYEAPFPLNLWASRSGSPQLTTNVWDSSLALFKYFTILTPTSVFVVQLKKCQTIIYVKWPSVKNVCCSGQKISHVENCPLLGYYAISSGNFLPTFRHNLSVPSSGFKNPKEGL
jgi:hypothetical protein